MAGSNSRPTVVVAALSLVAAMLVAASSVRVVAGANEQAAACSISDEDTVSRVKLMEGDGCLCELRRRVQRQFDTNQDMFLCISPPDIARCKPTCVIAERTVEYAAEVIKSGTDFKKQVLCDNTVQRALDVGDDCFCEFRSRVQAKVGGSSIDGALCGLTEKTSQCRRAACRIQDGDVQYCANALVESRDTNQEALAPMIGGPSQSEPPVVAISPPAMSPFLESLVHGCCSKVSKLSAACACEFNDALQKKVGNGTDHLTTVLPCMATTTDDCTLA
ncbi:unnamed protein product [Urochloa decumbens]|uniref:Uncharacterized protein n=1 Tax=Urochloa decumbens TaxID=240449 RepID=A0ABC9CCH0_9POAL